MAFGVPARAIHDMDRKGKTDPELAAEPTHEFHANIQIAGLLGAANVHVVEDTLEDTLWEPADRPKSSKDKPFRAWKRVKVLCDGKANMDHAPKLRDLVRFAFAPY
jgi:hypothetical protein